MANICVFHKKAVPLHTRLYALCAKGTRYCGKKPIENT